jgi:hypothetical protein
LLLLAQPVAGCWKTAASPSNVRVEPPKKGAPATIVLPAPDIATENPSCSV